MYMPNDKIIRISPELRKAIEKNRIYPEERIDSILKRMCGLAD